MCTYVIYKQQQLNEQSQVRDSSCRAPPARNITRHIPGPFSSPPSATSSVPSCGGLAQFNLLLRLPCISTFDLRGKKAHSCWQLTFINSYSNALHFLLLIFFLSFIPQIVGRSRAPFSFMEIYQRKLVSAPNPSLFGLDMKDS